jgi:hypothetical protein
MIRPALQDLSFLADVTNALGSVSEERLVVWCTGANLHFSIPI